MSEVGRIEQGPAALAAATRVADRVVGAAATTIVGKRAEIELAVACVLAGGHLLLEDVPGVGKTLLAQTLAAAIGGSFRRIQGTPDLLPGDVVGSVVPDEGEGWHLRFREGPVFANVVLFDELNRTSPRTQSALLEAAEEGSVSVDGLTHHLPSPFVLLATQNPYGQAGTYPLAEGTLDRFALALTIGRAGADAERDVLLGGGGRGRLTAVTAVTSPAELSRAQAAVRRVHLAPAIAEYVVRVLDATRRHPRVLLGLSTRGGLAVIHLAQARAVMNGRDHVTPGDVQALAVAGLAHRLVLAVDADLDAARQLMAEVMATVDVPRA
jgi:MoxR-like ATPase